MEGKMFPVVLFLIAGVTGALGHGRLMDPTARASLWRFPEFQHLNPPIHYTDNELFCGGVQVQYEQNGGKCGVCGDAWHLPQPRENEGGGLYGRGIIAKNYTRGQIVDVTVELTQSHLGYFEFRICPHNNPLVPVEQSCLDRYLLPLADGSGTRFPIDTFQTGIFQTSVVLPSDVTCRQCVFQWHYYCGNSWGDCEDGTGGLGCGEQEVFRGCSDVSIQ